MNSMKSIGQTVVLALLCAGALSGCRVLVTDGEPRRERQVYVEQPPPPPRQVVIVEQPPPPPPQRVVVVQREAYVYYPEAEVYYSPQRHVYYYRDRGGWREDRELPPTIIIGGRHGVTVELEGPHPYDHHDEVRREHPH